MRKPRRRALISAYPLATSNDAALTRRRSDYAHEQTWPIYFTDVRVGTIGVRAGVPSSPINGGWSFGFYPGMGHPGSRGIADNAIAEKFPSQRPAAFRKHATGLAGARPREVCLALAMAMLRLTRPAGTCSIRAARGQRPQATNSTGMSRQTCGVSAAQADRASYPVGAVDVSRAAYILFKHAYCYDLTS